MTGRGQKLIAGFGREQDQLTNSDDAPMAVSSPALDVADLLGEAKALPLHHLFARSTPDRLSMRTQRLSDRGRITPARRIAQSAESRAV
jgi:hypothetical protein